VLAFTGRIQPVYSETEIRQYVIVDDVVEKDGVGVECISRKDDAIIECRVLANGVLPAFKPV
jgi:hypothetical protein